LMLGPHRVGSRQAPLAQLAEQLTLNQWVPGSSPGGCTKEVLVRPYLLLAEKLRRGVRAIYVQYLVGNLLLFVA
jgi:hypothetical protein